jgi:hypothetical protein
MKAIIVLLSCDLEAPGHKYGVARAQQVAHAANGDDTLGMMYTNSKVDPELSYQKARFQHLWSKPN